MGDDLRGKGCQMGGDFHGAPAVENGSGQISSPLEENADEVAGMGQVAQPGLVLSGAARPGP